MGGPRTTVTLTVLVEHADEAKALIEAAGEGPPQEEEADDPMVNLIYHEVRNGELDGLDRLRDAGIAYDMGWGREFEFSAGCAYGRFDETGAFREVRLIDDEPPVSLDHLVTLVDDHAALKAYILEQHENTYVLPWDNQLEFGKRHKVMQVVDG